MNIIKKIAIENFRCHNFFTLDVNSKIVLINGDNGIGKTSLLEAISLISDVKSFRGTVLKDIMNYDKLYFAVKADILSEFNNYTSFIKLIFEKENNLMTIFENENKITKNIQIKCILNTINLTPEIEASFFSSGTFRREFFDKLCSGFDRNHTVIINRIKNLLSSRLKILEPYNRNLNYNPDIKLLDVLENEISKLSCIVAFARLDLSDKINNISSEYIINVDGYIENLIKNNIKILDIEKQYRRCLMEDRIKDGIKNYTTTSINKSILNITWNHKSAISLDELSSGEKKLMLINLIINNANAIKKHLNISSILLLDDLFSKIDDRHSIRILEIIYKSDFQTFIANVNVNDNFEKLIQKYNIQLVLLK